MDNDNMIKTNSIVMINEQMNKRNKISGRVYFDYVVLTIHKNTDEFQDNHICWLEEYVKNNLESAQNMPIVAQFVDCEKSEPLGHGFPGEKNGKPVIYDSEQVGSVVSAEIKDVDVNGTTIRALVATAYINEVRYPSLAQWLKAQIFDGKAIDTSVEIFAKESNSHIIADYISRDDLDFEICVPKEFDFGGSAILTVEPADSNAIVLEILNSRKIENEKEETKVNMEELKKELETAKATITDLTSQLNAANEAKDKAEKEKEDKEKELEKKKAECEECKSECEACKSECEACKSECEEKKAECEACKAKINSLEEEVSTLTEYKEGIEKENLISELDEKISQFSDELKTEVKDEIEDFKAEPTAEKSEAIINSLNALFVKSVLSQKNAKTEKKEDMKINSLFVKTNEADNNEGSELKIFE